MGARFALDVPIDGSDGAGERFRKDCVVGSHASMTTLSHPVPERCPECSYSATGNQTWVGEEGYVQILSTCTVVVVPAQEKQTKKQFQPLSTTSEKKWINLQNMLVLDLLNQTGKQTCWVHSPGQLNGTSSDVRLPRSTRVLRVRSITVNHWWALLHNKLQPCAHDASITTMLAQGCHKRGTWR
jgi:hypothetical protein